MSEKTQPQIIEFVKIKSWYIPADARSYQLLVSVKVPLLKIHQDFIPTLELATKSRGIRARSTPFSDTLNKFLDKIGSIWISKDGRKCRLTENHSVFTCKASTVNRKAISRLEEIFQEFASRWALRYSPVFSESGKNLKLVLDYKFDPTKNPVIPSVVIEKEPEFEIILGFTKIKIKFDVQRSSTPTRSIGDVRSPAPVSMGAPTHILEIFAQAGTDWVQVHTASFTKFSMGDIVPFLGCLGNLHAQQSAVIAK